MTTEKLNQLADQHRDSITDNLIDAEDYNYLPSEVSDAYLAGFHKAVDLLTAALKEQEIMDDWDIKAMLSSL